MENGSIVECINNSVIKNLIKLNTPYTVDFVVNVGYIFKHPKVNLWAVEPGIFLKGINHFDSDFGIDLPFLMRFFRELQLPGEIAEVLERELVLLHM